MIQLLLIIIISVISLFIIYYISEVCSKRKYSNKYELKNENVNILKIKEDYIELMKKIILNSIYEDGPWIIDGSSWPAGKALTMVGMRRLNNIHMLIMRLIKKNIKGDIIEAGCWRGGAMMFARTILNVYNQNDKKVYMSDSFSGIPPMKDSKYSLDKEAYKFDILNNNPVENVYKMLKKLNLESGTIVVKGFFNETLGKVPAKSFSLIRLDGDTYISTMQAITALYPKLSVGGYIIVDDYLDWIGCKDAITDYRKEHNINEEIIEVFHEKGEIKRGVYWEKMKNI